MHRQKIRSRSQNEANDSSLLPSREPNSSYGHSIAFHPHIFPLHREHQSSSMPPSMSSAKYILATKSSFLSSSSWTGGGRLLAIRFVRMAADGVETKGRPSFHGSLVPRTFSFLVPLLIPFSLLFVAALYENEKVTSYQRDRASPTSFPLSLSRLTLPSPFSLLRALFLVCSTSMSSPPPPPALSPAASMHSRDSL